MSTQHWIDGFFRKRLEHRMFPVEEGELEDVRTLLQQRNGTTEVFRGGGVSKWWLSALIPMAGALWWALSGDMDRSADRVPQATEDRRMQDAESATRTDNGANNAAVRSDASVAVQGSEPHAQKLPSAERNVQAAPENSGTADARVTDGQRSTAGTSGSGSNEVLEQRSTDLRGDETAKGSQREQPEVRPAVGMNTRAADARGIPRSDRSNVLSSEVDARLVDGGAMDDDRTLPSSDQAWVETPSAEGNDPNSVAVVDLVPARRESEEAAFMQVRWSNPPTPERPEPMRRDVETFKSHPMGELHVFGAPLTVRSTSRSGERSGAEMGSLVGLEYRVRAKRFAWATGIHYGSYTLRADQGAADVALNFVELPLLASKQIGFGRFKLMMQAGLSVDFLFNAKGQYPLDVPRTVAGFPDDAFQTLNCSWLLRPQAIYVLGEHLSVSAGPLWKGQLGAVATKGPMEGTHFSASGLSFGVTWRLDRSTF